MGLCFVQCLVEMNGGIGQILPIVSVVGAVAGSFIVLRNFSVFFVSDFLPLRCFCLAKKID